MAPYNLSDLAVKEMKMKSTDLLPAHPPVAKRKFIWSLLFDVGVAYFLTTIFTGSFHEMIVSFSAKFSRLSVTDMNRIAFPVMLMSYLFLSLYLNHGQTFGMFLTKCRMRMRQHHPIDALRGTFSALFVTFSLGLLWKKFSHVFVEKDHLWRELLVQKDTFAPDVRTLKPDEVETEIAEAA